MKKIIGIFLVLAMIFSVIPALEAAAADETAWTKVDDLASIGEDDIFAITITDGDSTYVLPVVQSGNNSQSRAIPEITGVVDGNTLTVSDTEFSFGWKLIEASGGYYIQAADSSGCYLYVRASNNGINIYAREPDSASYLWNILDCGLLGANSGSKYHTLSIDMSKDGWWTPGTTGGTADGTAYSTARSNVLGLWVLSTAHECVDTDPADHNCDICGNALNSCADIEPLDHNCDICGVELTLCTDDPTDGDHDCDICGRENITAHADNDNDKRCDDCGAAMCEGAHPDEAPRDHICDVCGGVFSECADAEPLDHNCDICGKVLSQCADAEDDQDHKCDICGKDGITGCVDAADDGDHSCDVCGNENISDHRWVEATIEAPETCTDCGATEGEPLPLSPTPEGAHWIRIRDLSELSDGDRLAITITIDGVTYILPNAKVTNSVSAPALDDQGTVSEDGRFLTAATGHARYHWAAVPAEGGGFFIKSGSMYLWVDNGNAGLRICDTDAPTAWKIFSGSKLLGAADDAGNLRTMCIRDGIWQSFKVSSEESMAHSSVRNNELGLWKYVPDANEPTGDGAVSVIIAMMEVYRQCGFSDYSTFFRAYKNHFGHAPTIEAQTQAIRTINS